MVSHTKTRMGPRPRLRTRAGMKLLNETERDSIRALEWALQYRNFHRPGDITDIPLTLTHMQKALTKTGSRRKGRDYARTCRLTLVDLKELENLVTIDPITNKKTGRVLKPKKQTNPLKSRWWPLYRVTSISLVKRTLGAYPPEHRLTPWVLGSLCRFLGIQPRNSYRSKPLKGSPRAAFMACGPP